MMAQARGWGHVHTVQKPCFGHINVNIWNDQQPQFCHLIQPCDEFLIKYPLNALIFTKIASIAEMCTECTLPDRPRLVRLEWRTVPWCSGADTPPPSPTSSYLITY